MQKITLKDFEKDIENYEKVGNLKMRIENLAGGGEYFKLGH